MPNTNRFSIFLSDTLMIGFFRVTESTRSLLAIATFAACIFRRFLSVDVLYGRTRRAKTQASRVTFPAWECGKGKAPVVIYCYAHGIGRNLVWPGFL